MDVGFLPGTDTWACRLEGMTLEVGVEGQVVKTAICEAISIIYRPVSQLSCLHFLSSVRDKHFAFLTRAMRLAFASVEIDL